MIWKLVESPFGNYFMPTRSIISPFSLNPFKQGDQYSLSAIIVIRVLFLAYISYLMIRRLVTIFLDHLKVRTWNTREDLRYGLPRDVCVGLGDRYFPADVNLWSHLSREVFHCNPWLSLAITNNLNILLNDWHCLLEAVVLHFGFHEFAFHQLQGSNGSSIH